MKGGIKHEHNRESEMRSEKNNESVMERGRMKDNYIEIKEKLQLGFQKPAYYVVMMSHAIDRYFSLSRANP